ncbi:MAG: isocitrate lyase/phosphoenolpyruvate mutase family protein [Actinobacteria bacterium]|nr:isocitrate lyase/phosphoenolpyruvate mutase family protein [Actinomycetota bacterium]
MELDRLERLRERFLELHEAGTFVLPNPYDVGSARLLEALGFQALATTSAGFAGTLGRPDMRVSRDELLDHVSLIAAAVTVPLNVDSERCFADDPAGVAATVSALAERGAAGCSIEDWDPATQGIDDLEIAVARVGAAAEAAAAQHVVLTARCENHLHGINDLDDTIRRLCAYRDAGAPVLYAPGLVDLADINKVVEAVQAPLNVLLLPGGPTVAQLAAIGVRRVSLGSALARIAHGAVVAAAREVLSAGSLAAGSMPDAALLRQAFTA